MKTRYKDRKEYVVPLSFQLFASPFYLEGSKVSNSTSSRANNLFVSLNALSDLLKTLAHA